MKSIVIGFAGKIASGKSTLSARFAEEMGWPYVSFGDYVRSVARQRGEDDSQREILQQIGESLIEQDYEGFCRAVVGQALKWKPGESLVIDGIRHLQVKQALEKLVAPSEFVLTYISVDEQIRRQRLQNEGIADPQRIERIESASTEVQVRNELPQIADITLDGTEQPEKLVEELKEIFTNFALKNDDPAPSDNMVDCREGTASVDCKTEDEIDRQTENTRTLDRKVPPLIPPAEFAAKWELEQKWMEENSEEYAGRWGAIDGDQLVVSGASAGEVYAALKAAGISGTLVTRIKHPDDLPFIE